MSLASQVSSLATTIAGSINKVRQDVGVAQDRTRALRTWYSALSTASTAPADVLLVAASTGEGFGATLIENRWFNVFRDEIRRLAQPVPASGIAIPGGQNYYGFGAYQKNPTGLYSDSPITASSGSISVVATGGLGLRAIAMFTSASVTVSFYGTGADIVYASDPTFGSFTYSVDGGGGTVQSTTTTAANGQRVSTIRGLTRGTHTVTITCTTGGTAGLVALEGMVFYDGDEAAGIRVWEGSHAGYKAQDFAGTTNWINSLQTWNFPSLVFIDLSANDYTNGRTSAQLKTDLQSIITLIKNRATAIAKTNPSFVLSGGYEINLGTMVEPWANYVTKMNEIAASDNDVTYVDLQRLFGPENTGTHGGLLISDGVHPTDAGYNIMGSTYASFVAPATSLGRMKDLVNLGSKQSIVGEKNFVDRPPVFSVPQRMLLVGTPGFNPPAGYIDVYAKTTDGRHYQKTSAGIETLLGANAILCTAATRPASPFSGMQIYETDTKNSLYYDGVAVSWKYVSNRAIVTSSTRPTGGLLQVGLEIFETDTGKTYVWYGGAWVQLTASGGLELGYAQITAASTANTTGATADVTGLSITITVGSRPIFIEFQGDVAHNTAVAGYNIIYIRDSANTFLGQGDIDVGANTNNNTLRFGVRLAPAAGSKTYKISSLYTGTGGIKITATTTNPAFIRAVEL